MQVLRGLLNVLGSICPFLRAHGCHNSRRKDIFGTRQQGRGNGEYELRSSHHRPGSAVELGGLDPSEELHDSDGGALAEDEGAADQGDHSPNCEDDSGEETVQVKGKCNVKQIMQASIWSV